MSAFKTSFLFFDALNFWGSPPLLEFSTPRRDSASLLSAPRGVANVSTPFISIWELLLGCHWESLYICWNYCWGTRSLPTSRLRLAISSSLLSRMDLSFHYNRYHHFSNDLSFPNTKPSIIWLHLVRTTLPIVTSRPFSLGLEILSSPGGSSSFPAWWTVTSILFFRSLVCSFFFFLFCLKRSFYHSLPFLLLLFCLGKVVECILSPPFCFLFSGQLMEWESLFLLFSHNIIITNPFRRFVHFWDAWACSGWKSHFLAYSFIPVSDVLRLNSIVFSE